MLAVWVARQSHEWSKAVAWALTLKLRTITKQRKNVVV